MAFGMWAYMDRSGASCSFVHGCSSSSVDVVLGES